MNRPAFADLIAVGESFTTEFLRSGQVGTRAGMRACASVAGGANLLGATDDGKVVGMAEAAGRSRFG